MDSDLIIKRGYLREILDTYARSDARGLKVLLNDTFNLGLVFDLPGDGFDPPIGTEEERASAQVWPGTWFDATGFASRYLLNGIPQFHTGADLNSNSPHWDADRHAPVYASGSGLVTFSGRGNGTWGNLVVIRHDPLPDGLVIWSRSAHMNNVLVKTGDVVARGQQIGQVGNSDGRFAYHLHFDMARTDIMERNPNHWPGASYEGVLAHYIDPKTFIQQHRPQR